MSVMFVLSLKLQLCDSDHGIIPVEKTVEAAQTAGIVDDDELEFLIGAGMLDDISLRGIVAFRQCIGHSGIGNALVHLMPVALVILTVEGPQCGVRLIVAVPISVGVDGVLLRRDGFVSLEFHLPLLAVHSARDV